MWLKNETVVSGMLKINWDKHCQTLITVKMVFCLYGEEVVEKKRVRLTLEEAGQMQLAEGKQQDHSAPSAAF